MQVLLKGKVFFLNELKTSYLNFMEHQLNEKETEELTDEDEYKYQQLYTEFMNLVIYYENRIEQNNIQINNFDKAISRKIYIKTFYQ